MHLLVWIVITGLQCREWRLYKTEYFCEGKEGKGKEFGVFRTEENFVEISTLLNKLWNYYAKIDKIISVGTFKRDIKK